MNTNAPSNGAEGNGAKAAPGGGSQEEPGIDDSLARLKPEMLTPLNAIKGFTKQLEMQCDNAGMTDNVRQILEAAHHLLDTINQESAEPDTGHRAPAATVNSPCDVLHIEDDSTSLASVKLLLGSKLKLKVLGAINGEDGIALARTHAPRLILLDLDLPDIHGSEVIERLQKEPATARIPVVVISGDTTPSQIERLLVLGAQNYLTKPFNPQFFLAVIDGILEEAARSKAGRRTGEPASQFAAAQNKAR